MRQQLFLRRIIKETRGLKRNSFSSSSLFPAHSPAIYSPTPSFLLVGIFSRTTSRSLFSLTTGLRNSVGTECQFIAVTPSSPVEGQTSSPLPSHHIRRFWTPAAHRRGQRKLCHPAAAKPIKNCETKSNSTNSAVSAEERGRTFPVKAIHVAQTIDLFPLMSSGIFTDSSVVRKQMFGKNSVVVQLLSTEKSASASAPQFVAVFRFGSIVCVNVPPRQVSTLVSTIKRKFCREPCLGGCERKEDFAVLLLRQHHQQTPTKEQSQMQHIKITASPSMKNAATTTVDPACTDGQAAAITSVVTGDYCILPKLDIKGVAVISNIMAQTVALDSYNDTVDDLLAAFALINSRVAAGQSLSDKDKHFLFQTVAQNNSIFIDLISKIRLKDRSEMAWKFPVYDAIHEGLREEFEIENRFQDIEFKINLVQENAKFFLRVLAGQKSNSLEWLIVWLISAECVLMCIEMSGMGEAFFAAPMPWLTSFFK